MTPDRELEADVFAQIVKDLSFLKAAAPVLSDTRIISNKDYRYIWRVYHEVYKHDNALCSPGHFARRLLADHDGDAERAEPIRAAWKALITRKSAAPADALEFIRRYATTSAMLRAAYDVADKIELSDPTGAHASMQEALDLVARYQAIEEPRDYADDAEARLERYRGEAVYGGAKTPLPTLTKVINGGLPPGNIGLIVAPTGVGKSSTAVAFGAAAILGDLETVTLHVTVEETEEEASRRYDAYFTGIDRNVLARGRLNDVDAARFRHAQEQYNEIYHRLSICALQPGSYVSAIEAAAARLRERFPGKLIHVVIDSPDDLSISGKQNSKTETTAQVYGQCKAMALKPTLAPICVWETTQAKGDTAKKAPDNDGAGWSLAKAQLASIIIHLREVAEDADPTQPGRTIDVVLTKNRLGEVKNYIIRTKARFGVMRFTEIGAFSREGP